MPSGHRPAPPVGTARVAISGHGAAGNPWVNVFWLNITATTHVAADLNSVITTMGNSYGTRFMPNVANAYFLGLIKASWIYASGQVLEQSVTLNDFGSGGSTYATDATCTLLNWSISDYYRGGHPRTYIPGTPDSAITNGRLLGNTFSSAMATAANGFLADVNAATHGGISAVALGTVRFASGNAWLSPPVFRAYAGASVSPIVGNQRRRLARS